MEADFNATNKIIYGQWMMDTMQKYKLMPKEIFSKKNRLANDGTLAKVLFYDIVWQARLLAGISAVDADNCYNRNAHPIASLVFQALGVPKKAAASMYSTIQNMQFFLCTGFGDSEESVGATGDIKTQGICQGNGAASTAWAVMSITIINAHKKKGHGVRIMTPISKIDLHHASLLFVDKGISCISTQGRLRCSGGNERTKECCDKLGSFTYSFGRRAQTCQLLLPFDLVQMDGQRDMVLREEPRQPCFPAPRSPC